MSEYKRLVKAAPQPFVPLQEAGLTMLKPLMEAVQKLPPSRTAPVLTAVGDTIANIAPLRLFDDFAPAHGPPEVPLIVTEAQVTADSTRSGSSFGAITPFSSTTVPEKRSTNMWCSKQRPSNSKSWLKVVFQQPEQLTGLYIAMPGEAKMLAESVGFEALTAPDDVNTPTEVNDFITAGKAKWLKLGVVPATAIAEPRRLPLSASRCVALRVSFKGFHKSNTDKYHALSTVIIYAASNKLHRVGGGATLYTESAEVLALLSNWLEASGVHASPETQQAALKGLCSLSLASGSLGTMLSLVRVLLEHKDPLHEDLALAVRSFINSVNDKFDSVGQNCNADAIKSVARLNPDRTAEAKFTDKSTNVEIRDGDVGHHVRSSSSPEYAAVNIGISKGRMAWEMKIIEDSRDGECQCFGICKKPVGSYSYDSTSDMWLWRAYNGQLYDRGSSTSSKSKYHEGDIVKFELDMDVGELRASVNGEDQGVLFSGLSNQGWTIYPCVQFYSSSRAAQLEKLWVYDGSSSGGAAGAVFASQFSEVEDETASGGPIAKGSFLEPECGDPEKDELRARLTLHGVGVRYGVVLPLATSAATAKIVYQLGHLAEEGKKKKKEAQPSPFDTFEAVVGIADFVTADLPAAPSSSSSASVSTGAEGSDSKVESTVELESKDDVPPASGVEESKEDTSVRVAEASSETADIVFKLVGDGRSLWTSPPIPVPTTGIEGTYGSFAALPVFHCLVNIKDVLKIELQVVTSGTTKNVRAVWGDARFSASPWIHERNEFENEMEKHQVPAGVSLHSPTADNASVAACGDVVGSRPLLRVASNRPFVFTNRLMGGDVVFTGPTAAAALLRVLRLFAREAYKPVKMSKPPSDFGESSLPLEVPFVVQAHGRTFVAFAHVLKRMLDGLKVSAYHAEANSLGAEVLSAALLLLKGNIRRVTAAKVLPADIGIEPPAAGTAGTLGPLLDVLNEIMAAGASGEHKISAEISAAAAEVLDTGLPLFYPNAASQAAFLAELLGKGEGGTLEVHLSWPTLLANSDKVLAAELAEKGAVFKDGSDPRFERLILLLQAFVTRRGWQHTTVGHFGKYIHLIISLPDTDAHPIVKTLSDDLVSVFDAAGLKGWTFPQGSTAPEVTFKVERFLQFNRRERLATEPGVGWLRLYPHRIAVFNDVVSEVQAFVEEFRLADERTAIASPSDASKPSSHGDSTVVDIFGDAVDGAAEVEDHHSVHTTSSHSSRHSDGGHGDDDDEEEDDGEEEHDDDDEEEEEEEDEEEESHSDSDAEHMGGLFD